MCLRGVGANSEVRSAREGEETEKFLRCVVAFLNLFEGLVFFPQFARVRFLESGALMRMVMMMMWWWWWWWWSEYTTILYKTGDLTHTPFRSISLATSFEGKRKLQ